jgi:hypothetical protein
MLPFVTDFFRGFHEIETAPGPNEEQRSLPDRRSVPTSVWDSLRGGGERSYVRRVSERRHPHFLERFSAMTLVWILLLLTFSAIDGLLTLELIEAGCHEVNPVLSYFFAKGPGCFLLGKYVLTAAGLPVLVLFSARGRIGYLIPLFVCLYAALIAYQLLLLRELA